MCVLLLIELCNEEEVIDNAKILIQRSANNYTRKIVCNEGYKAVGYNEQYCSIGKWTPYFKECASKKICTFLCGLKLISVFTETCGQVTLVNGTIELRGLHVAIMSCDKGFHLEPSQSRTIICSNGKWQSSIPRCVEDK